MSGIESPAHVAPLAPLARPLSLLGADDLPWIAALVDTVVRFAGQPWRLALDEIDAGTWMPDARAVATRRLNAALASLRRTLSGRAYDAALARKARSLVLGLPALTPEAREARITAGAAMLNVTCCELEQVLWADLPRERPIELRAGGSAGRSGGRPGELEVAALANVSLVQRALARAHAIELVIRGDAAPMLRGAAARGLLVTASERGSRETVLDIVGPLALCHGTSVYGRALGGLVPLLGACDFTLVIRAEARGQAYDLSLASPALLPAPPPPRPWPLVERLARDLVRLGVTVVRAPAAIASRGALVCPDLGVEVVGRTVWIEIVGFWTPAYLARKVARYRAAGAGDVVLCVDATRACDDDDPPAGASVMRFESRIAAEPLVQLLGAVSRSCRWRGGADPRASRAP